MKVIFTYISVVENKNSNSLKEIRKTWFDKKVNEIFCSMFPTQVLHWPTTIQISFSFANFMKWKSKNKSKVNNEIKTWSILIDKCIEDSINKCI